MRWIAMWLGAMVTACPPSDRPPPNPPPALGASCADACEHLRALGCELAEPTPDGAPCEAVCEHTRTGPEVTHWDTACLAAAKTCDACDPEAPEQP